MGADSKPVREPAFYERVSLEIAQVVARSNVSAEEAVRAMMVLSRAGIRIPLPKGPSTPPPQS